MRRIHPEFLACQGCVWWTNDHNTGVCHVDPQDRQKNPLDFCSRHSEMPQIKPGKSVDDYLNGLRRPAEWGEHGRCPEYYSPQGKPCWPKYARLIAIAIIGSFIGAMLGYLMGHR